MGAPTSAEKTGKPRVPGWLKKAVPVLVSGFILYYYFNKIDLARFVEETKKADFLVACLAVMIPQIMFWLMESWLVVKHIEWWHQPIPFEKYLWPRGAINFLLLINPLIGGGGGTFIYIQRAANISVKKLAGMFLFRFGLIMWGFGVLLIPCTASLYYFGLADNLPINMYVWWTILIVGTVWLFENWVFWFKGRDTFGIGKLLVKDRKSEFWTAFDQSTIREWLYTWAFAMPPIVAKLVGIYFVARAFGIELDFLRFMALAPLFTLIMDLPVAVGGLGTATLGWNIFFPGSGTTEEILAMTVFFPVAQALSRAAIGLFSLPFSLKYIDELFRVGEEPPLKEFIEEVSEPVETIRKEAETD